MVFTKRLRPRVRSGEITCSVRIWQSPRVKAGGSYPMDEGHILVESVREIAPDDLNDDLARRSGFDDVEDLLGVAKHGRGSNIYLVEFHYVAPPW